MWSEVTDKNNKTIYRYKECIDIFEYHFINDEGYKETDLTLENYPNVKLEANNE